MEGPPLVPDCFQTVRSSGRTLRHEYKDLKDHLFTREEKTFLCGFFNGDHSLISPPPDESHRKTSNSVLAWAKRFNVPESTIRGWLSTYKKTPLKMADSSGGRPANFDTIAIEQAQSLPPMPLADVDRFMNSLYRDTMQRRGSQVDDQTCLPKSSLSRGKDMLGMSAFAAQTITEERYNAVHDMRLVYKIAVMVHGFANHLDAAYKWNMDATTVKVSKSLDDQKEVIMVSFHDANFNGRVVQGPNDSHCVYVKWFHFCSAAGVSGPLVLIIAVDSIPENEFYASRVEGMKLSAVSGTPNGWLYAAKDRSGNAAMWKHFFLNVIIPTLQTNKAENPRRNIPNDELRTFFNSDGEAIILHQALDAEVLQAFADVGVDYMKGGPSTTSQHQPLDVSTVFRDAKAYLKKDLNRRVIVVNQTLSDALDAFFEDLRNHFSVPSTSSSPCEPIVVNSGYKSLLCQGIIRVCRILSNKAVTSDKIAQGFAICGHHVEATPEHAGTVSYDRIMRQIIRDCEDDHDQQEVLESLKTHFNECVEYAQQHGHLSNEFLDQQGLCQQDPQYLNRENLTLCRQDAQIITHVDSIKRIQDYKKKRSPEYLASEAEKQRAKAVLQQAGKERAKEAKKLADKEEEIRRKQSMTKRQRDEEVAAVKATNAAKKARLAEEKLKREQDAKALLGTHESSLEFQRGLQMVVGTVVVAGDEPAPGNR